MEILPGIQIEKRVRKITGAWKEIAETAQKEFGERGYACAKLTRALTIGRGTYVNTFKELGFNIERILWLTEQKSTAIGLHSATRSVREWLVQDICPNFLKGEGACDNENCAFKHFIPKNSSPEE